MSQLVARLVRFGDGHFEDLEILIFLFHLATGAGAVGGRAVKGFVGHERFGTRKSVYHHESVNAGPSGTPLCNTPDVPSIIGQKRHNNVESASPWPAHRTKQAGSHCSSSTRRTRYSTRTGKGYPFYQAEFDRIGTFHNLKRLLDGAGELGLPVFFAPMSYTEEDYTTWKRPAGIHQVMFENRMFEEGSWGAQFHPDLSPARGEIAIAGMIGTMCVESTARSCMERGCHATVFTDATASDSGPEAFDAMIKRYPPISHAVHDVDAYLKAVCAALT